jgi:restriction system protein
MPIPDYQSLMLPVLQIAAEGSIRVPKAAERVADELGLGYEEREELLSSGRQRVLHNRIHWAKFYITKAGLIDSPARGVFVATEAGKALLATNPGAINVETLKAYPAFVAFYTSKPSDVGALDPNIQEVAAAALATPEEQIDAAHAVLQSALNTELLDRVLGQSPAFFERLIVDLLVAMGYGGSHEAAALRLGKTGDGGIDGVIDEDRLGLDRIYIQAKRYAPGVGVGRPEIQGFVGSLVGLGATKGVFVTTSNFSMPAIDYAVRLPQRVILIDGKRLTELMIEYGVGVRAGRTVVVKRVDEDFFVTS